ncbi:MAG TPA: hypothetical protein VGG64_15785 [Pirellulales bacterium]|jgi:hypothetical protein
MKTEYLLPCACGETIVVDRSQAGLTARCRCGADIAIPTLRGLEQLQRYTPTDEKTPSVWGPRQATFFLGGLIAGLALVAMVGLWLTRPVFPQDKVASIMANEEKSVANIEQLSLLETFELWEREKNGGDTSPSPERIALFAKFQQEVITYVPRMTLAMAAAVVGVLILGVALLLPKTPKPRRPLA